jgi:hypothetical protein
VSEKLDFQFFFVYLQWSKVAVLTTEKTLIALGSSAATTKPKANFFVKYLCHTKQLLLELKRIAT